MNHRSPTPSRIAGDRRRILLTLLLLVIIVSGSLALEVFKRYGRSSAPAAQDVRGADSAGTADMRALHVIDTVRTRLLDVLTDVRTMNDDARSALPTGHRDGHVTAGALLHRKSRMESGYRLNSAHRTLMASPSISGNRLFMPGGFGSKVYYAFDLRTLEPLWTAELDDDGPSSAVCVDSSIVFNTESCTLFVLDQRTGKMAWSKWLGDPLMSTPMVANGRVYTSYPHAASQGRGSGTYRATHPFACFDLHKGTLLWQTWLDGDVLSTAVAHEGSVFLTTFPGTLYRLDGSSGAIEAAMALKATSVPAILGDEVFITHHADQDGEVMESIAVLDLKTLGFLREFGARPALHLDMQVQQASHLKTAAMAYDAGNGFVGGAPEASGALEAESNVGASNVSSLQSFMGSTIIAFKNSLYTVMGDSLLSIDPQDGTVRWGFHLDVDLKTLGGAAATAPVVSDDYVATVTTTGRAIICERKSGILKHDLYVKAQVRYPPIMHEGWLYVPTTEGELVSWNTHDPGIMGWPMLMRDPAHHCDR